MYLGKPRKKKNVVSIIFSEMTKKVGNRHQLG